MPLLHIVMQSKFNIAQVIHSRTLSDLAAKKRSLIHSKIVSNYNANRANARNQIENIQAEMLNKEEIHRLLKMGRPYEPLIPQNKGNLTDINV